MRGRDGSPLIATLYVAPEGTGERFESQSIFGYLLLVPKRLVRTEFSYQSCGLMSVGSGNYCPRPRSHGTGFEMNLTAMKISLKQLKRNLTKLKKGNLASAKRLKAIENTERRIAKTIESIDLKVAEQDIKQRPNKKNDTQFGYGDYKKYINSREWSHRKALYYGVHHKECRTCGSTDKELHLHHRTYERIFHEEDADLVPLCVDCHAALHLFQKSLSLSVEDATSMWISVTNGHSKKKKTREALRAISFDKFKALWRKRAKFDIHSSQHLQKTIERITNGNLGSQDDVIENIDAVKKQIAFSRRTGMVRGYDEKVDAIMRKLSSNQKGKT